MAESPLENGERATPENTKVSAILSTQYGHRIEIIEVFPDIVKYRIISKSKYHKDRVFSLAVENFFGNDDFFPRHIIEKKSD